MRSLRTALKTNQTWIFGFGYSTRVLSSHNEKKSVAVIGAGMSGLIAAKNFSAADFDVTVFEKSSNLGGVWSHGYDDLRIQTTRRFFEFPEFPFPEDASDNPTHKDVLEHIKKLVDHFNLKPMINFGYEMQALRQNPEDESWNVTTKDVESGEVKTKKFDIVILSLGLWRIPSIPDFPGKENFKGNIIHSSEYRFEKVTEGCKPVVIGFSKSGLDVITSIATRFPDIKPTLLFRSKHWVHSYEADQKFSRLFLDLMIPPPPTKERPTERFAKLKRWFRNFALSKVMSDTAKEFKLKEYDLMPTADFLSDNSIRLPEGFMQHVYDDNVTLCHDDIDSFTETGIRTKSGKEIETDLVISATGYNETWDFFSDEIKNTIVEDDGIYLYREVIHPQISNLGFCGRVSTFCSPLNATLMSYWLVEYFKGNIKVPAQKEILEDLERMRKFKRTYSHFLPQRSAAQQKTFYSFVDAMLADMGFSPKVQRRTETFSSLAYSPVVEHFDKKYGKSRASDNSSNTSPSSSS